MTKLTVEYLEDHLHHVHTPDSFARGLAFNILTAAKREMRGPQDTFELQLTARLKPIEKTSCIELCVDTPIGPICYHVEL